MELFTLFGKIATNADEANRDIDGVTSKAEQSESRMSKAFKRIGTALTAAFAVDKVVELGKKMVETTASVKALDSQFEQTFKNDQSKAMEKISKQAQDQNIHVDRLKGTWSSFYGTFKGNGANATQSLELTEKYMRLAADGAAYYDKSLEDVSSRLKSMTMGNFEAGDAIGLNLNATKLDTIAKEKYKKKWQDLSDTQKEYLLIDTASKIYENSGAMGQGAREADNLSNVVGNLKTTWERFVSIVGSPVLNVVINLLKGFTGIIEQLTAKVRSFNVGAFVSQLSDAGGVAGSIGDSFKTLQSIFFLVRDSFLQIVEKVVQTAKQWYTDNQDTINKIVETFNSCLGFIKQIISDAVTIIMALWDTFGKFIFDTIAFNLQLIMDRVNNVLGIISGIFKVISSLIKGDWQGVWEGIKTIFSNALEFVIRILLEQLLGNFINKIGQWGSSLLGKIRGVFSEVTGGFSGLVGKVKEIVDPILDILTKPFSGAFSSITSWIDKIKAAISKMFETHIKKPKFSFTGSLNPVNWSSQGLPELGIEWYADGGIMTKPGIFGINPSTGKLMAGGEPSTGGEAIIPLNKLPDIIAEALIKAGLGSSNQPIYFQIDGKVFAAIMAPYNDRESGVNVKIAAMGEGI